MKMQSEVTSLVSAAARPFRVVFDRAKKDIAIDRARKIVTLPMPSLFMSDEKANTYLSVVYDAIALARWGDASATARNKKGELEDPLAYEVGHRRAVAQAMDTWAGDAQLYEQQFRELRADLASADFTSLTDDQRKSLAASLIALKSVAPHSEAVSDIVSSTAPADIQKLIDKVDVSTLPGDSKEAADHIRKLLDIELPPQSNESESDGEDGSGEGEEGEGQGKGSGSPEDSDDGEGKGKAPGAGESNERPDPTAKLKPADIGDGSAIGADGIGTYVTTPDEHVVIADVLGNKSKNDSCISHYIREHKASTVFNETKAEAFAEDSSLGSNIRRLIQVKMRTRYENNKTSGKINRRAVHRITMPTVGDGTWNYSVFRKKTVPKDTTNTVVCVLVDYSGSMRGSSKTQATAQAAASLTKALSTVHVKHGIFTFTETHNSADRTHGGNEECLLIGMVKDFDRAQDFKESLRAMRILGHHMGQNGDADAVAWAYNQLKARKEKRKVLIVLSDGYPASSREGNGEAALISLNKSIEAEGLVEVYGIGIMSDAPRRFYKNNVVCTDLDQLEPALLNLAGGLFNIDELN